MEPNSPGSKSAKYNAVVSRARGGGAAEPQALAIIGDVSGMLVDGTKWREEVSQLIRDNKWEAAPQMLTLKGPDPANGKMAGDTLVALCEGNGPDAEFRDEETGEVTYELTWILSKNGVRVSILGSWQLNRKLPPFIGQTVSITRGMDQRVGTRVVTQYLVCGEMRPDGKPRDWAQTPKLLPAPTKIVETKARAAGAEDLLDQPKAS